MNDLLSYYSSAYDRGNNFSYTTRGLFPVKSQVWQDTPFNTIDRPRDRPQSTFCSGDTSRGLDTYLRVFSAIHDPQGIIILFYFIFYLSIQPIRHHDILK
jgi:hypothetical protein